MKIDQKNSTLHWNFLFSQVSKHDEFSVTIQLINNNSKFPNYNYKTANS